MLNKSQNVVNIQLSLDDLFVFEEILERQNSICSKLNSELSDSKREEIKEYQLWVKEMQTVIKNKIQESVN